MIVYDDFSCIDHVGDDRTQVGAGFGEVHFLPERVPWVADEYRDPDASVHRITEQRQERADASRNEPANTGAVANMMRLATLPLANLYVYAMPAGARRNPDWGWDEIVLACDLVMLNDWQQIGAEDARVVELSSLLQRMPLHTPEVRQLNFRNTNGVARKTADIATSHPDYRGRRTNGNTLDRTVLDEFRAQPDVMHALAESIRASVTDGEPPGFPREVGYDGESEMEGRYLLRVHAYRERSPGLRRRKLESVRRRGEPLACAACGFDFERTYGERGRGYVECHHVIPLHETGERRVSISDLALLCSNCHRMIHAKPPWPTPAELSEIIRRQAEGSDD